VTRITPVVRVTLQDGHTNQVGAKHHDQVYQTSINETKGSENELQF
jgi:hypothetical protein